MHIHHLNCATMCPACKRLVNGHGSLFARGTLVCHCLLCDLGDRMVLIDTGLGLADIADPARFGTDWLKRAAPRLDPEEAAVSRIRALGVDPGRVTDIVLTHLDRDHCGGIADFPDAQVHVSALERASALEGSPPAREGRYIAAQMTGPDRIIGHTPGAEDWFGLPAVRPLPGADILLVALYGHTWGHCGVAMRRHDGGWLLHAGDSHYHHRQRAGRRAPFGLAMFERRAATDEPARRESLSAVRRIAGLSRAEVEVICSHDPADLERFS